MAWKLTIKGLKEATGRMREAAHTGIRNGLEVAGVRGANLVRENIESGFAGHPPRVAYGILVSSVTQELEAAEGLIGRTVVFAQPPGDVYAAPVETGRKPGKFPPPDAMRLWVQSPKMRASVAAMAGEIRARRKGPRRPGALSDEERAERSLAFLVGRKVARRGTAGHLMFARAHKQLGEEIKGIMEAQLAAAIQAAGLAPSAPGGSASGGGA